jgi:Phosphotyrosine interaction domain (PTB/PID)
MEWRACYVLDCGADRAQTVISTMGQAFELRYKNFCNDDAEKMNTLKRKQAMESSKCDQDYYNDLPNKVPPEFHEICDKRRERLPSNLIDLNTSIGHDYVNEDTKKHGSDGFLSAKSSIPVTDVFDIPMGISNFSLSADVQRSQLVIESWYHGPISRAASEQLLKNDGGKFFILILLVSS